MVQVMGPAQLKMADNVSVKGARLQMVGINYAPVPVLEKSRPFSRKPQSTTTTPTMLLFKGGLSLICKDGEIERLSLEASELKKSKSQLLQLIEHKDLEINEKNSSIKGYLDKIVSLTDTASAKESRINELEAEHLRVHASLARLSQEKELVERHNLWLNDELTSKVKELADLRKVHNELEADMSSKLADLERTYNDTSSSLKWKDDKVKELESKLEALQNEFCSSKDVAAATEERLSAELSTVKKDINGLVEHNFQLREYNKHNFEECQKLWQFAREVKNKIKWQPVRER